jgi:hypothetical protein
LKILFSERQLLEQKLRFYQERIRIEHAAARKDIRPADVKHLSVLVRSTKKLLARAKPL